jgi:phenylpropionate dioxygenase-like ring-hydroxylating dioxygenase large terminal subunit
MIINENYINNDVFDLEMESIQNSGWVYVGLKQQMSENNDYTTYETGKVKLVIQNFEGNLKCFENICLHRFNKIQSGYNGNSALICGYHSWAYDADGKVKVDKCFDEKLKEDNRNCLKSFEVDCCGDFVFVNVNQSFDKGLKEYLGSFYEILIEISLNFSELINKDFIVIPHEANWKLMVENVLECYHCSSVHKETLVPIGIGSKKPENHLTVNFHDMVDYPIRIGKKQKLRNEKLSFLDKRTYRHDSLRHVYIFPNLFITSTDGILFYVGKLSPVSKGKSNLLVNFVKPKLDDLTKKESILSKAFFESSIDSSSRVIFEDKEILENIQKNLSSVSKLSQIFEEEEFRIVNFHKNIKKNVKYKS